MAGVGMNVIGQLCINLGTIVMKLGHTLCEEEENCKSSSSSTSSSSFTSRGSNNKLNGLDLTFISEDGSDGGESSGSDEDDDDDHGFNEQKESDKRKQSNIIKSRIRLCSLSGIYVKRIGILLFVCGGILNFVSFGYAAQSLLASLGSVQFVSNVVFGSTVLGEIVTRKTWVATFVIVIGNVLIVGFSNRENIEFTSTELRQAYAADYKYYIASMLLLLVLTDRLYHYYGNQIDKTVRDKSYVIPKSYRTNRALCYALISAILGTQQMLQAKCLSELMRLSTTGHENQLTNPFTYFVVFMYVVSTVFWVSIIVDR